MHTATRARFAFIGFVILVGLWLPSGMVHATPERVSLLYGEYKPQELISVADARVAVTGKVWRGVVDTFVFSAAAAPTPIAALIEAGSRFTVTCREPTTTIGIQFLGDNNDGNAKIRVDGVAQVWEFAVRDAYVEITDLPFQQQVIHVETMLVEPHTETFGHVTVVAFGCGPLTTTDGSNTAADRGGATDGASSLQRIIYLPTIMS